MTTVEERVANSVRWLDQHVPDWRERVDVEEFDLQSTYRCVLGQVFNRTYRGLGAEDGFYYARNKYGLGVVESDEFAFTGPWNAETTFDDRQHTWRSCRRSGRESCAPKLVR